jgi:hypothetical protein
VKIFRFGRYVFADTGTSARSNFGDLVARSTRVQGLDGGFDEDGNARASSEIGNGALSMVIKDTTATAQRQAVDALLKMAAFDKTTLWQLPMDASDYPNSMWGTATWGAGDLWGGASATTVRRYCNARVNSIQHNYTYSQIPQRSLFAQINWQAQPFWFSRAGLLYFDLDTLDISTGFSLLGARVSQNVSNGTTVTVTNAGNAAVPCVVTFKRTGGAVVRPGVRLTNVDAIIECEWRYNTTLADSATLTVDSGANTWMLSSALGDNSAYQNVQLIVSNGLLMLQPGANTITALSDNAATWAMTINYMDGWTS